MIELPDFDEEFDGDDEFKLIEHGLRLYRLAVTAKEKRTAMMFWLRGAALLADSMTPLSSGDSSPGHVLIAALEALNLGTTLPLLKPTAVSEDARQRTGEIARAKARAIWAVDWFAAHLDCTVKRAIERVAAANGMKPSALRQLRDHVGAGKKYVEVQKCLKFIREEETEMARQGWSRDDFRTKEGVFFQLRQDRLILDAA